jgi:hypothetical protein
MLARRLSDAKAISVLTSGPAVWAPDSAMASLGFCPACFIRVHLRLGFVCIRGPFLRSLRSFLTDIVSGSWDDVGCGYYFFAHFVPFLRLFSIRAGLLPG